MVRLRRRAALLLLPHVDEVLYLRLVQTVGEQADPPVGGAPDLLLLQELDALAAQRLAQLVGLLRVRLRLKVMVRVRLRLRV